MATPSTAQPDTAPAPSRVTIPVEGMTCAACQASVQQALQRQPGVLDAAVNLMMKNAAVTYDPAVDLARGAGRGDPRHRLRAPSCRGRSDRVRGAGGPRPRQRRRNSATCAARRWSSGAVGRRSR